MLNTYRYIITLTLRSPVLSQSLQGSNLGIDTAAWQIEKENGYYPALPGSLIRGNLLHSWTRLSEISDNSWIQPQATQHYLGQEAENQTNQPNRALLRFSDAWIATEASTHQNIHRITIDANTGTVKKGMLQTVQVPHPVGSSIDYVGWLEATLDEESAIDLQDKIIKGLRYISALGAFKGIGFGQIITVNIEREIISKTEIDSPLLDNNFGMALDLDRPFCFAKSHPRDSNRFESTIYIPGGAIKGAMANRIKQLGNCNDLKILEENLHLLRFTHAYATPINDKKNRATAIPLSIYLSEQNKGKTKCFDAVQESIETTLNRPNIRFQSDWKEKDWDLIQPSFTGYQLTPEHTLRVRSAIELNTDAAKDEALFSIEAINTDKHSWLSNISLEEVQEKQRQPVKEALLLVLSQGLNELGKTKAQSTITVENTFNHVVNQGSLIENNQVRILLQTDALLINLHDQISPKPNGKQLHEAYSEFWRQLSNNSLTLVNFFAKQSLFGGDYYWKRFCKEQKTYNPLLLTQAGSIFVFSVTDENKAESVLKQWQHTGLPQFNNQENWQTNPLIKTNGYGEVLINPDISSIIQKINQGN